MTLLQNSILIDEEHEYEEMIVDFWRLKEFYNQSDMFEAVALAIDTFPYYNPNISKEEVELHLLELWSEWFEERSYKYV